MADNIGYTPGAGATIAADDLAGVLHQRVKVSLGADGSATDLVGDASGAYVQGPVAHAATIGGQPVILGGRAATASPTAVSNGQAAYVMVDKQGRLVVVPDVPRALIAVTAQVTLSSTTETTLLAAGGAGVFHDLKMLIMTNAATQPVRLDFRDTTAGSVLFSFQLAPSGGGAVVPFPVQWTQATANTNWTVQASASASSTYISAVFVRNI